MTRTEKISAWIFLVSVFGVYAAEVFLVVNFAIGTLINVDTGTILWGKPAVIIHLLFFFGLICFLYGYFFEPFWIKVRTFKVPTEKLKNTSLRIVHISDFHCDRKIINEKKAVKIINLLQADLIVFTGDALNAEQGLGIFKDTMKSLKARLGKYAIHGNVDVIYFQGLDLFGDTGFIVLDRRTVTIDKDGETFSLTGLSCAYPYEGPDLLRNVPEEHFSIFLYHFADLIEELKGLNVDLYLAGHTHGGQVCLPFYGALITLSKTGKKYESGRYDINGTTLYVNRGLGLEGGRAPRVRFLARPEITVFDIKPKK